MAYVHGWNPDYPSGQADADTIDDIMRRQWNDLSERLATILEGGPGADPWVLKVRKTKTYRGLATDAAPVDNYSLNYWSDESKFVNIFLNASAKALVPLRLPVGATITSLKIFLIKGDAAQTVSVALCGKDPSALPFGVTVYENASLPGISSNVQVMDLGVNRTVDNVMSLFLRVILTNVGTAGSAFYGYEITWTE